MDNKKFKLNAERKLFIYRLQYVIYTSTIYIHNTEYTKCSNEHGTKINVCLSLLAVYKY